MSVACNHGNRSFLGFPVGLRPPRLLSSVPEGTVAEIKKMMVERRV
ncbi:hypothetical protein [Brucella sp. 10RB9215]|nr:hypothetical protein [Brucella sp. 10RB9215]